MKIVLHKGKNNDGFACETMEINGKHAMSAYPLYECPEDATLERDITSCSEVVELMRKAHREGIRGNEFVVEEVEMED